MVRGDFFPFVEEIRARGHGLAVLTNGTMLSGALVRRLASLDSAFVQVSLDGGPDTHDQIRGAGAHALAVAGIKRLVRARVRTLISFTAGRSNYEEFEEVARLGCQLRVHKVWADRYVPLEGGDLDECLDMEQTRSLFEGMSRARKYARRKWFCRTEVTMHRALQFLVGGGPAYRCSAGRSLLTVLPDGELLPCRRLPVSVGNLTREPMHRLYRDAPLLRELRDPRLVKAGCEACPHHAGCGGGLTCLAHAVHGTHLEADPGCWLAQSKVEQGRRAWSC